MDNNNDDLYQKPPSVYYAERLDACNSCIQLIKKSMRCGKCGCLIEHKAKWETATCPDTPERWKKQNIVHSEEK